MTDGRIHVKDEIVLLEEGKGYKVYEVDGKVKCFRSPRYNYDFYYSDGKMISWGETYEDDPERALVPNILDMEITTVCNHGCKFCFPAGTKIIMEDNTTKNIEDIKLGDRVKSYSEDTKNTTIDVVEDIYKRNYDGVIINIELEDGTIISTTDNHPIYVKDHGWLKAMDISVGYDLIKYEELTL